MIAPNWAAQAPVSSAFASALQLLSKEPSAGGFLFGADGHPCQNGWIKKMEK